MTETIRTIPMQASRRRSDRAALRLTAAAGAVAFGLAGVIAGVAASAPKSAATAPLGEPAPNADLALAKAVSDYEAAVAAQNKPATGPPASHLTSAPAPSRAKPTARPPAVVSGGS